MEQQTFITNKEKLLSNVINSILPNTTAADILVGYFYYSGYPDLSDQLKDKKVRILVGMDIDDTISHTFQEVEKHRNGNQSREEIRSEYYESLVNVINDTGVFDNPDQREIFRNFLRKIEDHSLEIRRTDEPCHAKLYIFTYKDTFCEGGTNPGTVITGSSNLSYQGQRGRCEVNVRCLGAGPYKDATELFEELWSDAVPVVDPEHLEDFRTLVVEKVWVDKRYPPYQIFLRALHEYFYIPSDQNVRLPHDITSGFYTNLKYQSDAVYAALTAIDRHNGVIIADVVGLGKSIIASTVAHNLRLKTIVVAPPHLCPQWDDYLNRFNVVGKVFSGGKIEAALSYYRSNTIKGDDKYLIIVDEAHRYRNEYTLDYALLHDLCQGNKVILLTATPFNNRPEDIFSLLKLFQVPTASTLNTVENLSASFHSLISAYLTLRKQKREGKLPDAVVQGEVERIAKEIRSIISPLVIRRSRIDLKSVPEYRKDLEQKQVDFSKVSDPIEMSYELGPYIDTYLSTLNRISPEGDGTSSSQTHFKAARYAPINYLRGDLREELQEKLEAEYGVKLNLLVGRQINTALFMRRLLVSRFESSVAAFRASLDYMISSYRNIIRWISTKGVIPIFKRGYLPDPEDFYESTDDGLVEIEETFERYREKGFFTIDRKYVTDLFEEDLESDLNLLLDIQSRWFTSKNNILYDPKLTQFRDHLRSLIEQDPKRKVVVFSSYSDTVNYLGQELQDLKDSSGESIGVFKYTGSDAQAKNKKKIVANFDAGLPEEQQEDDIHILIATDAISEGYNLHRAGAIINYDIPYNPTRVIQRIGRINRINKKVFDVLYIYNYFPSTIGEQEVHSKEISTFKMAMIHAIMGEDTKVLTSDEEVQSFFAKQLRDELGKQETESWDSKYRSLLDMAKGTQDYQDALKLPHRASTGREVDKPHKGVIIMGKRGYDTVFRMITEEDELVTLTAEDALELFSAEVTEQAKDLSKNFDERYERAVSHLFDKHKRQEPQQSLVKALAQIKAMINGSAIDKGYLQKLRKVLEADALAGYEVRRIANLTSKEYSQLQEDIKESYLDRILQTIDSVGAGDKTVILTEELR